MRRRARCSRTPARSAEDAYASSPSEASSSASLRVPWQAQRIGGSRLGADREDTCGQFPFIGSTRCAERFDPDRRGRAIGPHREMGIFDSRVCPRRHQIFDASSDAAGPLAHDGEHAGGAFGDARRDAQEAQCLARFIHQRPVELGFSPQEGKGERFGERLCGTALERRFDRVFLSYLPLHDAAAVAVPGDPQLVLGDGQAPCGFGEERLRRPEALAGGRLADLDERAFRAAPSSDSAPRLAAVIRTRVTDMIHV